MLFVDHGFLRLFYINRHPLGPLASRAAQPAPHQIRSFAAEGIRTIVNLRGVRECGSYELEREACRRYGITLIDCQFRSRAAPSREEIWRARDLFERIEYPMLMHCKSGADRAGLVSVLYAHMKLGLPIAEAKRQLSFRFGHIRQADTGILDHFFESYLAYNATHSIAFIDWVEQIYHPDDIVRSFSAKGWANRLVNGILWRE